MSSAGNAPPVATFGGVHRQRAHKQMDQRSASEEKEHQGGYAYHYSYESGSSDDGDSKRAKQSPKQSLKSGNKAESVPSEVAAPAGAGAVAAPAAAGASSPSSLSVHSVPSTECTEGLLEY